MYHLNHVSTSSGSSHTIIATCGYILKLFCSSPCHAVTKMPTRLIEFSSDAINTSVLYDEDGSFAFMEAYIKASTLVVMIYQHNIPT